MVKRRRGLDQPVGTRIDMVEARRDASKTNIESTFDVAEALVNLSEGAFDMSHTPVAPGGDC